MKQTSTLILLLTAATVSAQSISPAYKDADKAKLIAAIDAKAGHYGDLSRKVWEFAEVELVNAVYNTLPNEPLAALTEKNLRRVGGVVYNAEGMMVAAKTMALTAMDLFADPAQVKAAREHFEKRRKGFEYRSRVPEGQKPPLTYRDNR